MAQTKKKSIFFAVGLVVLAALIVILAATLSACSGDDNDKNEPAPTETVQPEATAEPTSADASTVTGGNDAAVRSSRQRAAAARPQITAAARITAATRSITSKTTATMSKRASRQQRTTLSARSRTSARPTTRAISRASPIPSATFPRVSATSSAELRTASSPDNSNSKHSVFLCGVFFCLHDRLMHI